MNPLASAEIQNGDLFRMSADMRLVVQNPRLQRQFKAALAALEARDDGGCRVIAIGEPQSVGCRYLMVSRMTRTWTSSGQADVLAEPAGQVAYRITIRDPGGPIRISAEDLAESFDLTATEAELAIELANGGSLKSFAASRKQTIKTTRWHWGNMRAKLHITSQQALIRFLLRLDID